MKLCYFGRHFTGTTYQEMSRGVFNMLVLTTLVKTNIISKSSGMLGISPTFPSRRSMVVLGGVSGAIRGALTALIHRIDILKLKDDYPGTYRTIHAALSTFIGIKLGSSLCQLARIPLQVSWKVVAVSLSDYGISMFMDQVFDPRYPLKNHPVSERL